MHDMEREKKEDVAGRSVPSHAGYMITRSLYAQGSPSAVENIVSSISTIVLWLSVESSHVHPVGDSLKNVFTHPVSNMSVSGSASMEAHPADGGVNSELELELELDRLELLDELDEELLDEELLDEEHSASHRSGIPGQMESSGSAHALHIPLQRMNRSR